MAIIDWLYPKRCPVCLDVLPPGKKLICAPCREKIPYVKEPVCYKCGKPLRSEEREYCRNCTNRMPPFEKNLAWAEYSSEHIRQMLFQVKYHGDCQLLDFPCMDFAGRVKKEVAGWHAQALIPVPIHRDRIRMRGYNQAEEIADRLSRILEIPVDTELMYRSEKTAAQKELSGLERELNLMHAFRTVPVKKKYRTVILVDDIYTTGSTLCACTRILKSAGIENVYCMVLAIGRDRQLK